jgi:hypothetical protein
MTVDLTPDEWHRLLTLLSAAEDEAQEFGAEEAATDIAGIRQKIKEQVDG